jgi:hypothetical protein
LNPTPVITLPTFHEDQARIYRARGRRNSLRCGRRWGKDVFQNTLAADRAIKGKKVGMFAPEHKQLAEPYSALLHMLAPIKGRNSRTEGLITTSTGGVIDLWPLTDNLLAGRGREYDLILINEAAFTKTPQMLSEIWEKSIEPTLLTTGGEVWVFSTPKGIDPENFFHYCCHDAGFKEHYAPSAANPKVLPEYLEERRKKVHPLVFQQEYLAEFVDWSGAAFFTLDKWLVDGLPVPMPKQSVMVFALLDTALKSGKEHDGTGVLYCALVDCFQPTMHQKLILLDYDLVQIDADLLPTWLPNVYTRLETLAKMCGARMGSKGTIIEDKGSGTVLLQHAIRRGWQTVAVDGAFVALGKDERGLSVSEYHYQELCKIAAPCYEKLVEFKGASRNHLVTQVTGFRLADKEAYKRADDLYDAYTSALSVTFGNPEGY